VPISAGEVGDVEKIQRVEEVLFLLGEFEEGVEEFPGHVLVHVDESQDYEEEGQMDDEVVDDGLDHVYAEEEDKLEGEADGDVDEGV